jgi:hypothetical protein
MTETEDDWLIRTFAKRSIEQLTRCGCDLCLQAINLRQIAERKAANGK